jgi:hypothetical protein
MDVVIKVIFNNLDTCVKYDSSGVYFDIYSATIALIVVLIFYSFLFYIHEFRIIQEDCLNIL